MNAAGIGDVHIAASIAGPARTTQTKGHRRRRIVATRQLQAALDRLATIATASADGLRDDPMCSGARGLNGAIIGQGHHSTGAACPTVATDADLQAAPAGAAGR